MLKDLTIAKFGEVLASSSPAPGGGSVAALSGMLGADLLAMVCRLTIGKAGYENHFDEVSGILKQCEALSRSLLQSIDLDTQAFNGVMAAFKLPKDDAEQKAARAAAIQEGYKSAIQSPLSIARDCVQVLEVSTSLLGKANSNALSDLGVAGQQAFAGLEGALMNVKINLPSIKDPDFVRDTSQEIATLSTRGQDLAAQVYGAVTTELASLAA